MEHRTILVANLIWLAISVPAWAVPNDQPVYEPQAPWVIDAPVSDVAPALADAPLRTVYVDTQVRVSPDGTQVSYSAYRLKVLKPEALAVGNLTVTWQPDTGAIKIHRVQRIRDGRAEDVLASTKFTVLQREAQLEQSTLNGERTATLQVPGLQVGDEIVFAVTITRREAVFDGRVADLMQMPVVGIPGTFRFRLTAPQSRLLTVRGSKDVPPLQPTSVGGQNVFEYVLRNPTGAIPTEGAPLRYNVRRLIEFTDFDSWADVSKRMAPLYEHAAVLERKSPIRAEAAAIAAAEKDPAARALAALPWSVPYPRYRCWATTIHLPQPGPGFAWSLSADPMYRKLGGFTYWRASGQDGTLVRTVMSTRSYEAEASPREAAIVNKAIPTFNNNMSQISEQVAGQGQAPTKQTLPFDDKVDWLAKPAPCSPGT